MIIFITSCLCYTADSVDSLMFDHFLYFSHYYPDICPPESRIVSVLMDLVFFDSRSPYGWPSAKPSLDLFSARVP